MFVVKPMNRIQPMRDKETITLFSTREKIRPESIELLTGEPSRESYQAADSGKYNSYSQFQKDFPRSIHRFSVDGVGVKSLLTLGDSPVKLDEKDEFATCKNKILEQIPAGLETREYFAGLMTHLTDQTFIAFFPQGLYDPLIEEGLLPRAADYKCNLITDAIKPRLEVGYTLNVAQRDNPEQEAAKRTVICTFYADKTIQLSMEQVQDDYAKVWTDAFENLTSMSEDKKKAALQNSYIPNDPYSVIAMDANQDLCKIVTAIENGKLVELFSIKPELSDFLNAPFDAYSAPDEQSSEYKKRKTIVDSLSEKGKKVLDEIEKALQDLPPQGVNQQFWHDICVSSEKIEQNLKALEGCKVSKVAEAILQSHSFIAHTGDEAARGFNESRNVFSDDRLQQSKTKIISACLSPDSKKMIEDISKAVEKEASKSTGRKILEGISTVLSKLLLIGLILDFFEKKVDKAHIEDLMSKPTFIEKVTAQKTIQSNANRQIA